MNKFTLMAIMTSFLLLSSMVGAQVPQILNYQGRVSVNGTNFDGTGQFQFALLDGTGVSTYWSNGNNTVSLPVTTGFYSVLLGDTNVTNMAAIPATVFTNGDVRLRVWFDGGAGLQQLTPDQRLTAVGYAFMADNVPNGAITSSKIASGAVTAVAIANGAVGTSQLANDAVTSANIATGAINSVNIASNTITAANMAPGSGLVPVGAIVLSATSNNAALNAAGFALMSELASSNNWTQVTNTAPWSGRWGHAAVVLNGRMLVLGGYDGSYRNDVWASTNGLDWTEVTNAAPWSARRSHAAVVLNDHMWARTSSQHDARP